MTAVDDLFTRRCLTLIAGPCAMESTELCLEVAGRVRELAAARDLPYIFKASFDKANRTSIDAFRGPGIDAGLKVLAQVKSDLGLPVLTDIHEPSQAAVVAEVVDVLQIPAFLCRQTDLIAAAASTGLPTNIKKGQQLAPEDMEHVAEKYRRSGGGPLAVTERGTAFGYRRLVVDMGALEIMGRVTGAAVIFDATHAVQHPGAGGGGGNDGSSTGGNREMAFPLARAAAAVGVDGIYCEVHPHPDAALSDGPNSLDFDQLAVLLDEVCAIDRAARKAMKSR